MSCSRGEVRYLDGIVTAGDDYTLFGPLRWANSTRDGGNALGFGEPNAVFVETEDSGGLHFCGFATTPIEPGQFIRISYEWQTVRVVVVCSGV